jgi:hypothetical protein
MDPNAYDKPEVFEPQRYVDNPNLPLYAFGFGRRRVPRTNFTLTLNYGTDRAIFCIGPAPEGAWRNKRSSWNLLLSLGH